MSHFITIFLTNCLNTQTIIQHSCAEAAATSESTELADHSTIAHFLIEPTIASSKGKEAQMIID